TVAAGPSWLELVLPGCGQRAVIGALAYPSEGRLKAMLAPGLDVCEQQAGYSERVGQILAGLAAHFRPDTVNLLVSHLYVRGGLASTAEADNRQLGAAYAVDPAVFPARTQYVALGHLHRPQVVQGAVVPVRYAGSPLVYSFAEAGQAKSVVLVEGEPGKPLNAREIYLSAGRPLVTWEATGGIDEVCRWLAAGKDNQAWIDLCLHVTEALTPAELEMLKNQYDRFVHIRPVFPGQEEQMKAWEELRSLPLEEQFGRFYRHRTGGAEPGTELVRLFMDLVQAVDGDETVALPEKGE
ncbi:MAG: exonuclease SbcCD subunit D C-terminal domain-containing protein, partial [Heliobacteriaceae bacterium]|nr:exonuclease SbcCD subunit D C-terminal domain-containing protein [Heliobacteriaceae bacterium]MDD4588000.1 exonuclease SbcCD subunit D C-terminal domain-containing protein [Heliobacteriaceae bacterium]